MAFALEGFGGLHVGDSGGGDLDHSFAYDQEVSFNLIYGGVVFFQQWIYNRLNLGSIHEG